MFLPQEETLMLINPYQLNEAGNTINDELFDISTSFTARTVTESGVRLVGSIAVTSLTDDSNEIIDDTEFSFIAGAFIPTQQMDGWLLASIYDTKYSYPLPFIAYSWVFSPNMRLAVGLPYFDFFWQPSNTVTIEFQNIGVDPKARVSYQLQHTIEVYLDFARSSWKGRSNERLSDDAYFSLQSWEVSAGAIIDINQSVTLRGVIGYAFDRELVEIDSWDVIDADDETIADVDSELFVSTAINIKF